MTASQISSPSKEAEMIKSVPHHAPRPTREWLAARVLTFLRHFSRIDVGNPVDAAMVNDWVEDLIDTPQRAIELAMWDRRREAEKGWPWPGDILARSRKYIAFPKHERPAEDRPPLQLVSPDRAAEIADEVGGVCARMFRTPSDKEIMDIILVVRTVFGVTHNEFFSGSKSQRLSHVRFAAAMIVMSHTNASLAGLGRTLGKCHTTMMHQVRRGKQLMKEDPDFNAKIGEIEARLRQ